MQVLECCTISIFTVFGTQSRVYNFPNVFALLCLRRLEVLENLMNVIEYSNCTTNVVKGTCTLQSSTFYLYLEKLCSASYEKVALAHSPEKPSLVSTKSTRK